MSDSRLEPTASKLRWRTSGVRIWIALTLVCSIPTCARSPRRYLDIATTTSVQNAGLLAALIPAFQRVSGLIVRVHAAGSGRALQMLADRDVDLAITHAPGAEGRFLSELPDWAYYKFAYNWFVLVGPPDDPADVRPARDVVEAFGRIADAGAGFVSRGDGSGTHERENALWHAAGRKPAGDRLIVSGRGMALALRHADEVRGYTLSDAATFWQLRSGLSLQIVFDSDPRLLNTYAVIYPKSQNDAAHLAAWLTAGSGRDVIAAYRIEGRQAFSTWPPACPAGEPSDVPCGVLEIPTPHSR